MDFVKKIAVLLMIFHICFSLSDDTENSPLTTANNGVIHDIISETEALSTELKENDTLPNVDKKTTELIETKDNTPLTEQKPIIKKNDTLSEGVIHDITLEKDDKKTKELPESITPHTQVEEADKQKPKLIIDAPSFSNSNESNGNEIKTSKLLNGSSSIVSSKVEVIETISPKIYETKKTSPSLPKDEILSEKMVDTTNTKSIADSSIPVNDTNIISAPKKVPDTPPTASNTNDNTEAVKPVSNVNKTIDNSNSISNQKSDPVPLLPISKEVIIPASSIPDKDQNKATDSSQFKFDEENISPDKDQNKATDSSQFKFDEENISPYLPPVLEQEDTVTNYREKDTKLDCIDMNANCQFWAEDDECKNNAEWMLHNCRKSCNSCPIKEAKTLDNPRGYIRADKNMLVKEELYTETSSGHFMSYFVTAIVFAVIGYLAFHNKQKIVAFVIEGRSGSGKKSRRPNSKEYSKLQACVEEVITHKPDIPVKNIIY